MTIRFRRGLLTAGALVVAVVLAGTVTGFASTSAVQTVHLVSSKPLPLTTLDFPPKGKSPGDLYVFSGTLFSPNGRTVIGRVRGTQTDIKIENGMETVQGMLTYDIGGSQLVVGGLAAYPLKGTGLARGKTFVRPVLGGSGRYAGAHGEVMSKQLANGGYDQVFKLTY